MQEQFNFDKRPNRLHTNSVKFDCLHLPAPQGSHPQMIPLWVADMDFPTCPSISKAITKVASKGIYGYSNRPESYTQSIVEWYKIHYQYTFDSQHLTFSPCVMTSIAYLLETLLKTGDKVLIQTPVYPEFASAIQQRGAVVVENPLLLLADGSYQVNWQDLEQKINSVQLMILCSPHNPIGKVWKSHELEKLALLLDHHQIPLIADEIHADLTLYNNKHYLFLQQAPSIHHLVYTLVSASKTFNLAAVHASSIIFPDAIQRDAFDQWLKRWHIDRNNIFSLVAIEQAYQTGYPWLVALRSYLEGNINFMKEQINQWMPKLKITPMEATYLMWIDCRELGLTDQELQKFFYEEAHCIVNMGVYFGTGGSGFIRLNVATQRKQLIKAIKQLVKVYKIYA
jgi:cysteine-S-conjugate beta-lyase